MAYKGTYVRCPELIWSNVKSDSNIMLGPEKQEKGSRIPTFNFSKLKKYQKQGHTLATHLNRSIPNQVQENLSFNHTSRFVAPFQLWLRNTWDYGHKHNMLSLGASVSKDQRRRHDQSVVSPKKVKKALNAHIMDRLQKNCAFT